MAYKQAQNRKKKLLKTFEETKNSYGAGVWYDEKRGYYYKYSASNTPGLAKSFRKAGNKKVRHSKENLQHGDYRKVFDYKWTIY